MSLENVIAFWQKVQNDSALRAKVGSETSVAPLVEIARQAGFPCTADELIAAESVIRFWTQVATDASLRDELASAKSLETSAASSEIVRVASGCGFVFTTEQLNIVTPPLMAAGSLAKGELDAEALSGVVGGARPQTKDLSASVSLALGGRLDPNFRVGPGLVPARV